MPRLALVVALAAVLAPVAASARPHRHPPRLAPRVHATLTPIAGSDHQLLRVKPDAPVATGHLDVTVDGRVVADLRDLGVEPDGTRRVELTLRPVMTADVTPFDALVTVRVHPPGRAPRIQRFTGAQL